VPQPVVRTTDDAATSELVAGFAAIRAEQHVPESFPPAVEAAAEAATAAAASAPRADHRDIDFVTLDPPGSRDLDQALALERRSGGGWRVWYAIADVAAFVHAGDVVDTEARVRGTTLYCPDERTPLHPVSLCEGAASLLPGEDRPALVWRIDLQSDGAIEGDVSMQRAVVHSRAALDYPAVQAALDANTADEQIVLLREIGQARAAQEEQRGGVSLNLPEQVVARDDGRFHLELRTPLAVEAWNSQLSLLAGIAAADVMLAAKVGVLRTLPPPRSEDLDRLRRVARALGVAWPAGVSYPAFVRTIDASTTAGAALLRQAAHTLRGAGYVAFDGSVPDAHVHGALATPYAHVTAPLRRLADRFANEVVLSLLADQPVPTWARDALDALPRLMGRANGREHALSAAILDYVEAMTLRHRVGEVFAGAVVDADERGALVQLREPPVLTRVPGAPVTDLGRDVEVRLDAVDVERRSLQMSIASAR
jgi:VacB/RNase II family 3'-5' exoribonuclease